MTQEGVPAFLFYVQDFLTDAQSTRMSLEARGAYVTLLCHEWLEGSLPREPAALAELLRVTPAKFAKLWPQLAPCFHIDGESRLMNRRLEAERRRQRQREQAKRRLQEQRTVAGRLGAAARWGTNGGL